MFITAASKCLSMWMAQRFERRVPQHLCEMKVHFFAFAALCFFLIDRDI